VWQFKRKILRNTFPLCYTVYCSFNNNLLHWNLSVFPFWTYPMHGIGGNGKSFTHINEPLWRTIQAWRWGESGIIKLTYYCFDKHVRTRTSFNTSIFSRKQNVTIIPEKCKTHETRIWNRKCAVSLIAATKQGHLLSGDDVNIETTWWYW